MTVSSKMTFKEWLIHLKQWLISFPKWWDIEDHLWIAEGGSTKHDCWICWARAVEDDEGKLTRSA